MGIADTPRRKISPICIPGLQTRGVVIRTKEYKKYYVVIQEYVLLIEFVWGVIFFFPALVFFSFRWSNST